MPVVLHFQSTGTVPGDGRPVSMVGNSLTVGRGTENDMVLPDPDKLVSKRHCTLEKSGDEVVVVDLSSNGTFLNYGKLPLGPTPTPLNNGDILTMGSYEILIEIAQQSVEARGQATSAPAGFGQTRGVLDELTTGDIPGGGTDFLDDLLGPDSDLTGPGSVKRPQPGDDGLLPPLDIEDFELHPKSGAQNPDPHHGASQPDHSPDILDSFSPSAPAPQSIPDDWDEDFLAPNPFDKPEPQPDPAASSFAPPIATPNPEAAPSAPLPPLSESLTARPGAPDEVPPETVASPLPGENVPRASVERAPVSGGDDAAVRAFLKAAGAEGMDLSGPDTVPTFSRLGHVFRILVQGMREILMTRSSIKSEFRIEHTRISAGGNNPLKFSVSPEQAIDAMIKPSGRGYLDATDAANQALQDIKAHEVAMIAGMEAALKGVLARLSPDALEGRLQPSSGLGGLLSNKKARYWEIYQDMYAEISDEAEKDFQELFSKEFARAYEAQLERLK